MQAVKSNVDVTSNSNLRGESRRFTATDVKRLGSFAERRKESDVKSLLGDLTSRHALTRQSMVLSKGKIHPRGSLKPTESNETIIANIHQEVEAEIDQERKKKEGKKFAFSQRRATIRSKLPTIDAYQQIVKFPAEGSGRVILRLERLMGSSVIRPVDATYMKTLRGRLEEEEKNKWKSRISERTKVEYLRCRKLVLDGHIEPMPGMEDVFHHPVFRVNRIIDRLDNVGLDLTSTNDHYVKPPHPIKPREPFEELATTGYLFGDHPGHYLKVTHDRSSTELPSEPSFSEISFLPPVFDADGKLIPPPTRIATTARKSEDEKEDMKSLPKIVELSVVAKVERSGSTMRKEDMEAAKKKYGIGNEDVEAMWHKYESPLIHQLTATDKGATNLFEESSKVLKMFNREEMVTDYFINKTYRRLLPNN